MPVVVVNVQTVTLSTDPAKRSRQVAAIRRQQAEKREPNAMLRAHVRNKLAAVGIHLDPYDPDFLVGIVMEWLGQHDAILTPCGVEHDSLPDLEEDL